MTPIHTLSSRLSPRTLGRRRLCLALGALTLALGCQRQPAPTTDALVRVGKETLTVSQLQAELDRLSMQVRAQFSTPSQRLKFVQRAVDQEVLAAEAERLGYAHAPEVVAATKKAMAMKLLREKIGTGPEPGEVTELAVREYYAQHPAEFGPPERARVAIILVKDAGKAQRVLAEAESATAQATGGKSVEQRFSAFSDLVKKYTEEAGARDITLALHFGTPSYPQAVLDAAAALTEVGALSPVIDTAEGHYILQLKEHLAASTKPFEEVKGHAARAVSEAIRDRKLAEFVAAAAKKLDARVYKERFASVRFDAGEAVRVASAGDANEQHKRVNQ